MDRKILKNGLLSLGYEISKKQENKLSLFSELLVEWNNKMNLTSVTAPEDISVKHFLDSIVPIIVISPDKGKRVIDVGTGAGFPGMPIKIIREDLDFTFMDSLNKRINFLKEVSEKLELEGAEFIHARAEDAGKDKKHREKYDYAVSRAVAPLRVLSEYCIPFLKVNGIFMAFKSYDIDEEISDAKSMIGNLGAEIREVKEIKIPNTEIIRKIVLIEKIKETPSQFPRRANKIK